MHYCHAWITNETVKWRGGGDDKRACSGTGYSKNTPGEEPAPVHANAAMHAPALVDHLGLHAVDVTGVLQDAAPLGLTLPLRHSSSGSSSSSCSSSCSRRSSGRSSRSSSYIIEPLLQHVEEGRLRGSGASHIATTAAPRRGSDGRGGKGAAEAKVGPTGTSHM